ncbi:hypothetical protein CLCR_04063 [Cladophialophora carrionii]|uniref:Uncharacterized protein n=1 Tax=Cladophialophora carrionii TaxID=86049 RepID=A0A1C1CI20_9EURO|nr:hypothetical protein CLCR_04063 [Cladophialophora carrionii]
MEPPPSRIPRRWTAEEDSILRAEATYQLIAAGSVRDWNRIASKLPGRMNKDCRKRWSKISENVKKGNWDSAEDARLREAVKAVGTRWTQVAEMVGTRHADQCSKRWTQCLDPSIDHSDWTEGEDDRLLAEVATAGRNWRKIAESFPGRTKLALKNRVNPPAMRANGDSPSSIPGSSARSFSSVTEDMMQLSDGTPSSEEEAYSSMSSTRPPSRSSTRSQSSLHQAANFNNMVIDSSSRLETPTHHSDSGELFQYLPPTPDQRYSYLQSMNHQILNPSNFSPVNLSTLSEPMLTPRPEYLAGSSFDNGFPLHASSFPNGWLSGSNRDHSMNGFPFPESFDMRPLNGGSIDQRYPLQPPSSRKTTIVLEDIEEATLSRVMSILIQEKAKVSMETTHTNGRSDHR